EKTRRNRDEASWESMTCKSEFWGISFFSQLLTGYAEKRSRTLQRSRRRVELPRMLLDARANIEARDMNGDSPLSWASWYARPDSILRMLCYDDFHIRPNRRSMAAYLLGEPHV